MTLFCLNGTINSSLQIGKLFFKHYLEAIRTQHQLFVDDAEHIAADYYDRRKYKNRISTQDAKKYQGYLDKKIEYQDKLLIAIKESETENQNRINKSQRDYQMALEEHGKKNTAKGWGLGGISIIATTLLYFCLWYIEYYDFKTVSQYGILVSDTPKNKTKGEHLETGYVDILKTLEEQSHALKNKENSTYKKSGAVENEQQPINQNEAVKLPIGFFSEDKRQEQLKNLYIQHIQPYIQSSSAINKEYIDRHTVPHNNFKTGKLEYLDFGTVNNRVGIYLLKIQKSLLNENSKPLQNQFDKLSYWMQKRGEFLSN